MPNYSTNLSLSLYDYILKSTAVCDMKDLYSYRKEIEGLQTHNNITEGVLPLDCDPCYEGNEAGYTRYSKS